MALATARKELQAAWNARREGLEGRSRVNARRAVATVLAAHYIQTAKSLPTRNGFTLIELASQDPLLPTEIRAKLETLCTRVNIDFSLGAGIDLLEISTNLVGYFTGGNIDSIT